EKDLALAKADIAMHKAGEIAGVGGDGRVRRQVLVDLAGYRSEIDAVTGRLPFFGQQPAVDRVQPIDPAAALAGIRRGALPQQRLDDLVRAARNAEIRPPDPAHLVGI